MLFAAEEFVAATTSPAVMVASCRHPVGLVGSAFGFVCLASSRVRGFALWRTYCGILAQWPSFC
eukprot:7642561-Alexandrium_andersonii.AAC.1